MTVRNPVWFFHENPVLGEAGSRLLKRDVQQGRKREITGGVPSGYVEDYFDLRTPLAARFSNLSEEGGQRRIHDRMTDQPFQPCRHQILF